MSYSKVSMHKRAVNWLLFCLGITYSPLAIALSTENNIENFNNSIDQHPIVQNVKAPNQIPPDILKADPFLISQRVSNKEIAQMTKELEELIYRVESTLIAAEAKDTKYAMPMTKVAETLIRNKGKASLIRFGNRRAHKAIVEAKAVLANFPQLARTNFPQARQDWLDARRNLWDKYPVDRRFAQPEIRSIWLDRGTIVKAKSKSDLTGLFDRMAEAGINTIFFETVNASYPIYPSRVAPEQNPLTRGWDPLQAAIELAHERDMELHAWVWVFSAANQGHNQILNQPKNYLGPVLSRYPDWALKDKNGQLFNRTPGFKKAFYDPANPEVRRYLMALFEEITTRYEVDGIQLDYIRYPFQDGYTKQTYGYTNTARSIFKQNTGVDPAQISRSSHLWKQWAGFKMQQVDSFVAEVSNRLKQKRPDLIISAAVFPMERQKRLFTLQQNWEAWLNNEWIDVLVLMTYALDTDSFEDRTKPIYDHSEKVSSLILPGIRLLNVPDKEALDKIQLLRNMPTGGYALFAAENLNNNLQGIFKQTQGLPIDNKEPIPHRKPFETASARYKALQKEWNFLLVHNQVKVKSGNLKEWSRESEALLAKLNNLASNPSNSNFMAAQSALSSFRQKLPQWTRQHEEIKPLQVESWKNRLVTLESLMKYGKRTVLENKSSVAKN